jgi:hypothetical protein
MEKTSPIATTPPLRNNSIIPVADRAALDKNTPNDFEALIATTSPLTNQLPYSDS